MPDQFMGRELGDSAAIGTDHSIDRVRTFVPDAQSFSLIQARGRSERRECGTLDRWQ